MTGKLVVFVTCQSREEAERIAQTVVEERLAACVNVLAGVRSCYMWEGQRQWSSECLLLMKTTDERYAELEKRVRELNGYEVPEIVAVGIERGLGAYLRWIGESVGGDEGIGNRESEIRKSGI